MPHTFPYPVIRVPTSEALHEVQRLRGEGSVPVILGSEAQFKDCASCREDSRQGEPQELLSLSEDVNVASWLSEFASSEAAREALEDCAWPLHGRPVTLLWALNREGTERAEETVLALLPASESWMAPCLLKVGGVNFRPRAHVHAALARYWHQRYGAEIAAVVGSTVEFTVNKPPRTKDEAVDLALQHYAYCDDHVCQNHYSFGEFAASLLNATVWSFWWD